MSNVFVQSMLDFISKSPVAFYAVRNLKQRLLREGYRETEHLEGLEPGGKYFISRNDSTLIAFRLPETEPTAFTVAAAHSDSPCLRIRDTAELPGLYLRLNTERYGGMIQPSWVDRPLSVAGRVLVRGEKGMVEVRYVDMKKDMALIPNLAVHLNRGINEAAKYEPGKDLVPLYGEAASAGSFYKELLEQIRREDPTAFRGAAPTPEDVLSADLYLYNNQPGSIWGPAEEFVSAPRLDDLAAVYACTEAFLAARDRYFKVPLLCVFDNEEIGSGTRQGAASDLLPRVLQAISRSYGLSPEAHGALLDQSFMLSCDNAHARHPNHPEASDSTEAPVMNGGVAVKHSPRYATDGLASGVFCGLLKEAGIPYQHYSNRPDLPGGGTLGLIADTMTPVPTVDIGMAQLAMHSAYETMGSRDPEYFRDAVKAVYEGLLDFNLTNGFHHITL